MRHTNVILDIFETTANNNIGGSIPTEIGLLSDLDDMKLEHNSLTGTLPSELGLLSGLWFFHASKRINASLYRYIQSFPIVSP